MTGMRQRHSHRFLTGQEAAAEKRVKAVMVLTLVMMAVEIAAGAAFNSMALMADGWHMGTHASAFGIATFAYAFSRRYADDPHFTFGTGKITALAGFTSAIALSLAAALIGWESVQRLTSNPVIAFDEALTIAVAGLAINLASAVILRGDHHHETDHHHHHHDHNILAAYAHVLADALTSLLAIIALLLGKFLGWWWADPAMGVCGAAIIALWAWSLMRNCGAVLVDYSSEANLATGIHSAIERDGETHISDLHLWMVGPSHWAVIIELETTNAREPAHYKALVSGFKELCHITVEVNVGA